MSIFERERTSTEVVMYALYLYILGLSFRNTSKAIQPFGEEGRSHICCHMEMGSEVQSTLHVFTVAREYLLF
jgi:hypothetical protein